MKGWRCDFVRHVGHANVTVVAGIVGAIMRVWVRECHVWRVHRPPKQQLFKINNRFVGFAYDIDPEFL